MMLLIRRLWLLPFFAVVLFLFYLSRFYSRPALLTQQVRPLQKRPERYPVSSYIALPTALAKQLPTVQHDFAWTPEHDREKEVRLKRRAAVKEAFVHTWSSYRKHAFGKDEIRPLSGVPRTSFGGWGATLVDSMDTLWLMDMKDEFEECVAFVERIDFTVNTEDYLNVFETTIRYLGGLLGAYDISGAKYPILLNKAVELGEILYMAFDTPNRMPVARWQWSKSVDGIPLVASKSTLLAELGSLDLEFTRLSQLTGDDKYFDAVQRLSGLLAKAQDTTYIPGLWPTIMDAESMTFNYNHFTMGGMADSTYEYLPKQFMLLGGLDGQYRVMYEKALSAAKKYLFYRPMVPGNPDILLSGNAGLNQDLVVQTEPQGQHLACFTGGMVALAGRVFGRPSDIPLARRLVDGCIWFYHNTPSGLMPETFHVAACQKGLGTDGFGNCEWTDEKWYRAVAQAYADENVTNSDELSSVEAGKRWVAQKSILAPFTTHGDNRYILRPEAIESIFILFRLTGDPRLPDAAWEMFEKIVAACKTPLAFAGIVDVCSPKSVQNDRMESFWLAETLKYFYLIFADPDLMSLDEFVLNTEAHPLKRPTPEKSLHNRS